MQEARGLDWSKKKSEVMIGASVEAKQHSPRFGCNAKEQSQMLVQMIVEIVDLLYLILLK